MRKATRNTKLCNPGQRDVLQKPGLLRVPNIFSQDESPWTTDCPRKIGMTSHLSVTAICKFTKNCMSSEVEHDTGTEVYPHPRIIIVPIPTPHCNFSTHLHPVFVILLSVPTLSRKLQYGLQQFFYLSSFI